MISKDAPQRDDPDASVPPAAVPVWAGIVVSDLDRSVRWYSDALSIAIVDRGATFAVVRFRDGSAFELVVGDPTRPGSAFPSYGTDPGPAVMPGFRVLEPAETARQLVVARWLPDWIVVVGPLGLRSVLCRGDGEASMGLVDFDIAGPDADALSEWYAGFGASMTVAHAERLHVVPVVAGLTDDELCDPDGTTLRTVT